MSLTQGDTHVLFVCTGNICRSPTAAALLTARIAQRSLAITVSSAGLLAGGNPAPPELIEVAARQGVELAAHRSVHLERPALIGADLVIGMAREHVREAVLAQPPSFSRTFTLREYVRRAAKLGPRTSEWSMEEWTTQVHGDRRHRDLLGGDAADDVSDPIGGSARDYEEMIAEVSELVRRMVALTWPDT
jgi:protein-tyrosine phosphatase